MSDNKHFEKESMVYFSVDTETGGLDYKINPILELAVQPIVKDRTGKFVPLWNVHYNSLIKKYNPALTINTEALKANKIALIDIRKYGQDGKSIIRSVNFLSEQVMKKYAPSSTNHNHKSLPILVGHNIDNFDIDFLEAFWEWHGDNLWLHFNKSTLDTYTLARIMFDGKKDKPENLRQTTLCDWFEIDYKGTAHRALADAQANSQLFCKIYNHLNRAGERR